MVFSVEERVLLIGRGEGTEGKRKRGKELVLSFLEFEVGSFVLVFGRNFLNKSELS